MFGSVFVLEMQVPVVSNVVCVWVCVLRRQMPVVSNTYVWVCVC